MLGWHVSVFRKLEQSSGPASADTEVGSLIAQWQGSVGALDWLDGLCTTERCVYLGGNGYPSRYTTHCGAIRTELLGGPPLAREVWLSDPGDTIDWSLWKGATFVDHDELSNIPNDEWLLIVAWDES